MLHERIAQRKAGFKELNSSEIDAVGGGWTDADTINGTFDPLNDSWNHSSSDVINQILMTGSMGMDEYGGFTFSDADGDGVHDSYDYMNGADDDRPHIHGTDGTTMGQNADGTWTLYDANGNATEGAWSLQGINVNTGSSVGVEASNTSGGFTYSGDGNSYTFVPVG